MPTPKEHWDYTIQEWSQNPFTQILNALPKQSVIYDIGANVGGFTEVLHNKFPNAEFYCFEPVGENIEELKLNVPYAHAIQSGVYYGATKAKAMWRGANCGAIFLEQVNSGEPRIDTGEEVALCELESLDIPKPTLIKLDVEGAEENILEFSTMTRDCPYLIIEWHPDHINPIEFFAKHLPNHKIMVNLDSKQFLLCIKSL